MRFKADEIVSVLQAEIEQYRCPARRPRSRPGARSGRRHRPRLRPVRRHGRRDGRVHRAPASRGLAFNLEENSVGVIILGEYLEIAEGDEVSATGQLLRVPVGDALIGRVVDPLGNPLDGKGPIVTDLSRPVEIDRSRRGRPAAGQPAAADRHQGHRRHDADRPRPARADHRRPQDRQDGHRHRHDHQPEAKRTSSASTSPSARRNRPWPASSRPCRPHGAMDYTIVVVVLGGRPGAAAIHRALRRLRHGRVLHVRAGPRHPVRLRRPDQAGRRLSPAVAADAASARPRGLSRRHFLCPLALAGTLGQAGRALGHRAQRRRRHQGRRRLGRQP